MPPTSPWTQRSARGGSENVLQDYRVGPERARTGWRWLYLTAWKAATTLPFPIPPWPMSVQFWSRQTRRFLCLRLSAPPPSFLRSFGSTITRAKRSCRMADRNLVFELEPAASALTPTPITNSWAISNSSLLQQFFAPSLFACLLGSGCTGTGPFSTLLCSVSHSPRRVVQIHLVGPSPTRETSTLCTDHRQSK